MVTAKIVPDEGRRTRLGPVFEYFLIPWVGGTVVLLLLVLALDPAFFSNSWALAIPMSAALAWWCFLTYLVYIGKGRAGFSWKLY